MDLFVLYCNALDEAIQLIIIIINMTDGGEGNKFEVING